VDPAHVHLDVPDSIDRVHVVGLDELIGHVEIEFPSACKTVCKFAGDSDLLFIRHLEELEADGCLQFISVLQQDRIGQRQFVGELFFLRLLCHGAQSRP